MEFKNIIVEKKEGIASITINRPEVLNALNIETRLELQKAINDVQMDEDVNVVIITGKGRAFIAGSDIKELSKTSSLDARKIVRIGEIIDNLDKVVIAAVNGFALGGGCEIAMACDIVVASENAKFGQTEINLGIIPGGGGTQRLPRLVGGHKAKELIFTGDIIDANEAWRLGLVNKVVGPEELETVVREIARKIADKSPLAIKLAKTAMNRGLRTDLETGLALERELYSLSLSTEDKVEGITAFLEKRKAKFKGTRDNSPVDRSLEKHR